MAVCASLHHFLDTWAPLAEWAVAFGTLALALATAWLGFQARDEAKEVGNQASAVAQQVDVGRQQVAASKEQLESSQRPFVLPVTSSWYPDTYSPIEP